MQIKLQDRQVDLAKFYLLKKGFEVRQVIFFVADF